MGVLTTGSVHARPSVRSPQHEYMSLVQWPHRRLAGARTLLGPISSTYCNFAFLQYIGQNSSLVNNYGKFLFLHELGLVKMSLLLIAAAKEADK